MFVSAQGAPAPVGIAHVAVRTSDVDREVGFLGKLGFQQAFVNTDNGRTTEAFIKVNDRQYIEVYPQAAQGEAPGALGMMHACYEAADLEVLQDQYKKEGLAPADFRKAGAGNLLFNLKDPDGRTTEFTQYMPGSRQMEDMGQHLGDQRVSDELMGFEMPVRDLKISQKFYEEAGFDAMKEGATVRLSLPTNPDVSIVLRAMHGDDRPRFFLPVDDAKRAENQLRSAGLDAVRDKKQVIVHDPDGNEFVLIEVAERGSRHLIPWKK
jgi:catechol 2,3-dioxygenase-like lactoylglutathione lyase family enzyme